MYRFDRAAYEKRVDWFRKARFGMFIHWGLYSIPGRGEWVRSEEQMPESEYLPFFESFAAKDFDPTAWAKAAKAAGNAKAEAAAQKKLDAAKASAEKAIAKELKKALKK